MVDETIGVESNWIQCAECGFGMWSPVDNVTVTELGNDMVRFVSLCKHFTPEVKDPVHCPSYKVEYDKYPEFNIVRTSKPTGSPS